MCISYVAWNNSRNRACGILQKTDYNMVHIFTVPKFQLSDEHWVIEAETGGYKVLHILGP